MSRLDLVLINPCSRPQVYQSLWASLTAVENPVWAGLMATFCPLKGLSVDASLWKAEEREIAEDLIIAAHADARRKAETLLQDKMKQLTGGLPLPPGLKLF